MRERLRAFYGNRDFVAGRLTAAYVFIWSWFLLFTTNCGNGFFPIADAETFASVRFCYLVGIAAVAVIATETKRNLHPIFATVGFVVGQSVVLASSLLPSNGVEVILAGVGALVVGYSLGSVIVYLNAARTKQGYASEPRVIAQSIFPSVAVFLVLDPLPPVVALVYLFAAPVLFYCCVPRHFDAALHRIAGRRKKQRPDVGIVVAYVLFGLVNGALLAFDLFDYRPYAFNAIFAAASWVCAVAAVLTAVFVARRFETLSANRIAYSFVIVVFVVLFMLFPSVLVGDFSGMTVVSVALVILLVRVLFFRTKKTSDAQEGDEPSFKVQRSGYFGTAESSLAEVVGFVVAMALSLVVSVGAQLADYVIVAEVSAIIAAILLDIFHVPAQDDVPPLPQDEKSKSDVDLDAACAAVAQDCGLTSREAEILRILADGYSLPYVQEKLCIARGTASTHCTHIYQKLGIHKRDELMDVLADYQKGRHGSAERGAKGRS